MLYHYLWKLARRLAVCYDQICETQITFKLSLCDKCRRIREIVTFLID